MENKAVEWGYRRRVHEVEKQYYFWIVAGGVCFTSWAEQLLILLLS